MATVCVGPSGDHLKWSPLGPFQPDGPTLRGELYVHTSPSSLILLWGPVLLMAVPAPPS